MLRHVGMSGNANSETYMGAHMLQVSACVGVAGVWSCAGLQMRLRLQQ